MLEEDYKEFLPDIYSEKEKEIIINGLFILSELILDSEDLMKSDKSNKIIIKFKNHENQMINLL